MPLGNTAVNDEIPQHGWLRSIRTKLIVPFSLLFATVMAMVIMTDLKGLPFTPYIGSQGELRAQAFRDLSLVADLKKEWLLEWLANRRADAKMSASYDMVLEDVVRLRTALRQLTAGRPEDATPWALLRRQKSYRHLLSHLRVFMSTHGIYHVMHIVDAATGKIIVSTNDGEAGYDVSQDPAFIGALASRDTYMTDMAFDPRDNAVDFHISRVIADRAGKALAVWIAEVSPEDIIKPLLHTGAGLGISGEVLLVNRYARILTSLKYPLANGSRAEPLEYKITSKPAAFAARGDEGIIEAKDYRGKPVLAAYRYIPVTTKWGWGLVVKRDQAELFAPLHRGLIYSEAIALAGVLVVVGLTIMLARGMTRPLVSLSRTVQRISAGDLAARVEVTTADEVGHLAMMFNAMLHRLQHWRQELEAQVAARTAELQTVNDALRKEMTEHQRAEVVLQESEKRFRTLVEQAHDAITVLQHGKVVYRNPTYIDLLGYTVEDTAGRSFLEQVAPEDRDRVREYYHKRLQGEEVPGQYEITLLTRHGRRVPVEIRPSVIEYQGQPATLVTLRDLTERKRMEEQLRQSQKMEAIGVLAGGIAHDFNNILSAIIGYTELVTLDIPRDTLAGRNLREVLTAAGRAKNLVQQILTFSRRSDQERKPVQLSLLVKETLTLLRASLPTTIAIQQHCTTPEATVLADPTQMHQILMNLGTNAEHAMRATGGLLEVRLDSVEVDNAFAALHPPLQPGPHVRLTIRDTGPGMQPEVLERIFEPFFTTKEVGEGTGMGLAMVHGIVMHHGGAITVESAPGKGATFVIYLPRIDEMAPESAVCEDPIPHGTGSILFVDDEVMLARWGQSLLEQIGYTVTSRTSSIEALAAFRANPQRFDLVITDQTMPHMTGEALARELRCLRPDIPIILCTGFSRTMDAEKAQVLGIDAFCMKPLVARELAMTIQRLLTQQSA